ncbi:hypothetical protein ASF58_24265 [Methylobacterium sp. Leaf125]|nr:hypothetical protein ASF58_24265 [Methylobacterium sp. Leaf125]
MLKPTKLISFTKAKVYRKSHKSLGFDPRFYKSYYKDTDGFKSDYELLRHYVQHGKREGRSPSSEALIRRLESDYGALPNDFVPSQYRLLHGDLSGMQEPWAPAEHYLRFGRKEKREYRVDLSHLEEEFRDFIYSRAFSTTYGSKTNATLTFFKVLRSAGLTTPGWIAKFNLYEFTTLNENWLPHRPFSRMDGLYLFLTDGIERLAPVALGEAFEPTFYRQHVQDSAGLRTDADLYRDWLNRGIGVGIRGNEQTALRDVIGDGQFPACFDEHRYRKVIGKVSKQPAPGRYNALKHYVTIGFALYDVKILDGGTVSAFVERIAEYHLARANLDIALKAFDRALALNPGLSRLHHRRGDCLLAVGRGAQATESFLAACGLPGASLWSHIHAANGLAKDPARIEEAIARLLASAPTCHGSPAWRMTARSIIEQLFQCASETAFALHRKGDRAVADTLMEAALDRTGELIRACDPLPATLGRRATGHVVLVANRDLPQCDYYRVQQRAIQLIQGGWTVEVINQRDASSAHPAIDRASAVIFYRVAASPIILHAILYARALGVVTLYDIDDLIFDARFYPEPLTTYEGQVTEAEYLGLQFGVPLFRYAARACDIGLTSTAALAEHLGPLVRSGQCHILRNGLDTRNDRFLAYPRKPFSETIVTVFYGSATKAHSQDFSGLIAPALLQLFAQNGRVRLAVAGYVPLDRRFDPYRERIIRLGFNADVMSYWEVLSGADINIAVLSRNPATDAKSEIKWLEAAMFGIPSVVSPTATYRDALVDGEDAIFAETSEDWARALGRLASDAVLRDRIGAQARAKATRDYGLPAAAEVLKRIFPARDPSLPPRLAETANRTTASLPEPVKRCRERRGAPGAARKPRILVVNVYFPPHTIGGATRVVRDNIDYFIDHASDEFELVVLASDDRSEATYETRVDSYRGVPVFRIGSPAEANMDWRPFNDAMAPAIEVLMQQFDPDLVHFHCIQRLTGTAVDVAARLDIPYLVTCHDGWWISDFQFLYDEDGDLHAPSPDPLADRYSRSFPTILSIARRRRLARLLDGAERVLCVSDSFAEIYRVAGVRNVLAVPNGIPALGKTMDRTPNASGRVRLGHIGGRTSHKGATLIEIVLRRNAFHNLELTLVDHAWTEGHSDTELWGETPVTIVGFIAQDKITDVYAGLDVLLAPSIWPESFGLVTREALACGLWVVASDRGAIGSDVVEGVNGFVVDVSSADDLTRVLSKMNANAETYLAGPPVATNEMRTSADQCRDLIACYQGVLSSS